MIKSIALGFAVTFTLMSPPVWAVDGPSIQAKLDSLKNLPKDVVTELILDASGSMKQVVQQRTKLLQAKRVLRSYLLQAQNDKMILGLRVYGLHEKDCKSTELVLKFGETGVDAVEAAMDKINPKGYGKTPLALSLEHAAQDLRKFPNKPKRLIVVTDGADTCQGDPCEVAKKLKKEFDISIYVVGLNIDEEDRSQISCMAEKTGGTYTDASDLQSLNEAVKKLSDQDHNLFVKSPEPLGTSMLWKINPGGEKRAVGSFVSSLGTTIEPGVTYEVVVGLTPPFKFQPFKIAPHEKKTLTVSGKGLINIRFMDELFNITLLNAMGVPVESFPSDRPTVVPVGHYKAKIVSPPFSETTIDDVAIYPEGKFEEGVKGFGTLQVDTDSTRPPGPYGYYIYDDIKKVDIGSYLTGTPVVLPLSRYLLKSDGNCLLRNVYPESNTTVHVLLPPPGKTVTFKRREKEVPGETPKGPAEKNTTEKAP